MASTRGTHEPIEGGDMRALDRLGLVLCTRDRPHLLSSALAAMARVMPAEVERIVVDSGSSTDETARVAAAAGVQYVRSDVPGLSIARNLGLATTTRDIVIFTDDDCEVQLGCAEALLEAFSSPEVGAATGTLRDGTDAGRSSPPGRPRRFTAVPDGLDAGHGALMAFRVDALRRVGGFDPVLGAGRPFGGAEDLDAFCRILQSGLEVAHAPEAVVHHMFTRSDDDYEALNHSYGLGLGAMSRKWAREGGGVGRTLAAKALRRTVVRLMRRPGDRRARRAHLAFFTGFVAGYRRAGSIPVDGLIFIDEHAPAPITITSSPAREEPAA